jgi:hypothetical protein
LFGHATIFLWNQINTHFFLRSTAAPQLRSRAEQQLLPQLFFQQREKKKENRGKIIYKTNSSAYIWFRWQIRIWILFNALLCWTDTLIIVFNALLRWTDTLTFLFNALLCWTDTLTFLFNALLCWTDTLIILFNALVRWTDTLIILFNALLRWTDALIILFNALLRWTDTLIILFNALLRWTDTLIILFNTLLRWTDTLIILFNALLRWTDTLIILFNTLLRWTDTFIILFNTLLRLNRHIYNSVQYIVMLNRHAYNSWFQAFAVFWMSCELFWFVLRRMVFNSRRFGTLCLFYFHRRVDAKWVRIEICGVVNRYILTGLVVRCGTQVHTGLVPRGGRVTVPVRANSQNTTRFSHWDPSSSNIPTITPSVTIYSSHPSLPFTTLGTISAYSYRTPWWWHFEMPKHVGVY